MFFAHHPLATSGWHNQRDSVPPSLNAGRAGGGLFLFHVLTLPVVAVDRIPSPVGVGLRQQVGQQFKGELVDVLHASSLFFCLLAVITNDHELFATIRRSP